MQHASAPTPWATRSGARTRDEYGPRRSPTSTRLLFCSTQVPPRTLYRGPGSGTMVGIIDRDDRAGTVMLPTPDPRFPWSARCHPQSTVGAREEHVGGSRSPQCAPAMGHVNSWQPALIVYLLGTGFTYGCYTRDFSSNSRAKITKSAKIRWVLGLNNKAVYNLKVE